MPLIWKYFLAGINPPGTMSFIEDNNLPMRHGTLATQEYTIPQKFIIFKLTNKNDIMFDDYLTYLMTYIL